MGVNILSNTRNSPDEDDFVIVELGDADSQSRTTAKFFDNGDIMIISSDDEDFDSPLAPLKFDDEEFIDQGALTWGNANVVLLSDLLTLSTVSWKPK